MSGPSDALPTFLDLPARQAKPRRWGLTHVLDKGLTEVALVSLLELAGDCIDFVKLGWGTAYVTKGLRRKIEICHEAGVHVTPGGTLLEIAAGQGKLDAYQRWAQSCGFDAIEVSDGTIDFGLAWRSRTIKALAQDFIVLAEVGCKDPQAPVDPMAWAGEMVADLAAGATYVIAEGRESGTVGIYEGDGSVKGGLIETLTAHVPAHRIIFEAPSKASQVWFMDAVGVGANLGNIAPDDVLSVETLRRGLRADTVGLSLASSAQAFVAAALQERTT